MESESNYLGNNKKRFNEWKGNVHFHVEPTLHFVLVRRQLHMHWTELCYEIVRMVFALKVNLDIKIHVA